MVKMYSPAACASCTMSTAAGKFNLSASGTIHLLVGNVGSLMDGCIEVDVILWQNGRVDPLGHWLE